MPTGYTFNVGNGELTEFADFAMQCARAFGALMFMRDDLSNAPIPEKVEPDPAYAARLAEAQERVAVLSRMTLAEAEVAAESDYTTKLQQAHKYAEDRVLEEKRLRVMLEKVMAWTPPTSDHVEMKKFMIEQLTISMPAGSYRPTLPGEMGGAEWLEQARKQADCEEVRCDTENVKEIKRARERTRWLVALRESLREPETAV